MKAMNEAIEAASDFNGMLDKLKRVADSTEMKLRVSSQHGEGTVAGSLDQQRQPGENRAAHRARLKRERRARAKAGA